MNLVVAFAAVAIYVAVLYLLDPRWPQRKSRDPRPVERLICDAQERELIDRELRRIGL
jgi:hypothetical protein